LNIAAVQACLGLLALTCGQVLFWRRRDNVIGYLQGGLFVTTLMIPLLGTTVFDEFDPEVTHLYANLIAVGGAAYLVGLCVGAPLGSTPAKKARFTFVQPDMSKKLLRLLTVRTRTLAIFGGLVLAAGFLIMGYAPLLASNRVAAKYGIGHYAAGFERGALVYRLGLALASTVLPIALAVAHRRKKLIDWTIGLALIAGLSLSLSRGLAFSGVLLFGIALAISRKVRAGIIFLVVALSFVAGSLSNEIFFSIQRDSQSLATRVAAHAPDIRDHLSFLRGFRMRGEQTTGWTLIAAGISPKKGHYDPSTYALRTVYGDVEAVPSGGLRLPAPLWGYVSFGFLGAALWSFMAGFFTGWGTTRIKGLLDDVYQSPDSALNLTVATVFFTGTYGVLSSFYFASTALLVQFAIALYMGRILAAPERFQPARFETPTPRPRERIR